MYSCCNLSLHGICFYQGEIVSCCYAPNDQINGGLPPVLFPDYKGQIIPKEQLFKRMRYFSSQFKNGSCPIECKGCFQIKEADWDESEYIDFITITNFSCCNINCVYCSNNLKPYERSNNHYKVLPFLKYLKDNGVLRQNLEIHVGGGEFSIYSECDAILEEFGVTNFAKIYIATNALHYSESLNRAIKAGSTYVVISLDCGTRKTYKKIKRVDAFDKVVENIHKYAKDTKNIHTLTIKYIIIPGINDNFREFKKFLKIAKSAKYTWVRVDIEGRYLRSVNNNANPIYIKMAKKMIKMAENQGFLSGYHAFLQQAKERKTSFSDIIDFIKLKYFKTGIKKFYTNEKY